MEESELAVASLMRTAERIFHYAGEHGIGHHKTAVAPSFISVRKQAEGVSVSLEVGYVVPKRLAHLTSQLHATAFGEERLDGFLAGVAERRVSHVMGKAGCRHDSTYFFEQSVAQFRAFALNQMRHIIAQRTADA